MSVTRVAALCAAAGALLGARIWLSIAPGRALRWGSRIAADHDFTGRGSRESTTGRRSRGSTTGRRSRGSHTGFLGSSFLRDPRDPRPVVDPRDPRPVTDLWIRDLRRAVLAVGVRPPFSATCLEQGVALVMLLTIARIPAHLVVGVSRQEPTLRAHAWVECDGVVVLGGAQAQGLTPLLGTRPSRPSSLACSCHG